MIRKYEFVRASWHAAERPEAAESGGMSEGSGVN